MKGKCEICARRISRSNTYGVCSRDGACYKEYCRRYCLRRRSDPSRQAKEQARHRDRRARMKADPEKLSKEQRRRREYYKANRDRMMAKATLHNRLVKKCRPLWTTRGGQGRHCVCGVCGKSLPYRAPSEILKGGTFCTEHAYWDGKTRCEVCGGPLARFATVGVCSRNPKCNKERKRRHSVKRWGYELRCELCSGPLTRQSKYGICQRNPECFRENKRRNHTAAQEKRRCQKASP